MKQSAGRGEVAVLHVKRGFLDPGEDRLRLHASVPYISTFRNVSYPYSIQLVDPGFSRYISRVTIDVRVEFNYGRQQGSERILDTSHMQIITPKKFPSQTRRYRSELSRISRNIVDQLGLERIIQFIFSLRDEIQLLQIFTDMTDIPWDWIYDAATDLFLCEVFGVGVTLTEEVESDFSSQRGRDLSLSLGDLQSSDYTALLVGNSYPGTPLCLADMNSEINDLASRVRDTFGPKSTFVELDSPRKKLQEILARHGNELRLIYLSGHFTTNGFRCADHMYLKPEELSHALKAATGGRFSANPVVFLNGCSSGYAGGTAASSEFASTKSLAEEFLRLGAAACVFTSLDVRLAQARHFTDAFMKDFFRPGTSLGAALLTARRSFNKDQGFDKEQCYEWAAYHLLGGPNYVMVRQG